MELGYSDLPTWLLAISWTSLGLGVLSALFIAVDIVRRPQPMKVMDAVWPIDGLWGSVGWVAAYLWWGRASAAKSSKRSAPAGAGMAVAGHPTSDSPAKTPTPGMHMHPALGISRKPHSMPVSVFIGTSHCGAGCSMADLIVEWLIFLFPGVAVVGGLHWMFSNELFAGWVISYVVALLIGVTFQYAAIAPMNRARGVRGNIKAAAKADVLSLSAWQVGMYGAMALGQLWVFPATLGGPVATDTPVFWFMMQLAMLLGFCTAYPVNWFLIRSGIKERM